MPMRQLRWMIRPTMTVTMYIPSWAKINSGLSMSRILAQIRLMIPMGEYLKEKDEWDHFSKLYYYYR